MSQKPQNKINIWKELSCGSVDTTTDSFIEVHDSNPLAAAVCALGQGTLSSLPSPLVGTLKLSIPSLLAYKQLAFLVARLNNQMEKKKWKMQIGL